MTEPWGEMAENQEMRLEKQVGKAQKGTGHETGVEALRNPGRTVIPRGQPRARLREWLAHHPIDPVEKRGTPDGTVRGGACIREAQKWNSVTSWSSLSAAVNTVALTLFTKYWAL